MKIEFIGNVVKGKRFLDVAPGSVFVLVHGDEGDPYLKVTGLVEHDNCFNLRANGSRSLPDSALVIEVDATLVIGGQK